MQRFLALIALRRELQHRSRIAFELWPDSDEPQARTNLRKLLHEIRQALPDIDQFLEIDTEIVTLLSSKTVEVDALRFQAAVAADELETAASLYSGDLVPACYDEWLIEERTRFQREAHTVFSHLAESAGARNDHEDAIAYAQRVIDMEPTDESAARIQMEAHVATGDRAAALRAYHRCTEALERELAIPPSTATEALYQQLQTGASEPAEIREDTQTRVAESPFVGREAELDRLCQAWNTARKGRAHLVLVTGEPGIGKSRLAQELGRRVRAEGHGVASTRAYEAAGRPPWGPVVDLLRSEALRGQIETLDTVWRNELSRLLPEYLDTSQQDSPSRAGDLAQRYRLLDAVSQALTVGDRPRLLIIDDLQWCDAETIEMIGFVARAERTAPILIVGTVRSEEVSERHPLHNLVDALTRDGSVTTVALDRLDESTTGTLAAKLRETDTVDHDLVVRLWRETDGNPLFILETLRAGLSADGSESVLTPTIRAVLGARLEQLTQAARNLAEVSAVIGRPFSIDFLAAVTGMPERELVNPVDELWRRRVIRDQGFTYDFSHDKLRAVALEMTSPARRRQFHRAVAEAIARELDASASPQLAAHYDRAGMIDLAIDAYRVAGARAVAVSALDEAVAMFRRALSLLADVPASSGRDALELDTRIALGSPLVALDGYGSSGAHQLYERALSLCRKLGRPVDLPILRGLGLARLQGCQFDESRALGQALLESEPVDPISVTEGRYLLGVSAFWCGELASAREHLVAALETYDEGHRDQHLALYAQDPKLICLVRLALVYLWQGDADRASEMSRAAFMAAKELDHLMTSWYVVTYAAIFAAEIEDSAQLVEILHETDRLWQRLPMPYLMIVGEALRGWLEVSDGCATGIEKIERSVERSRAEGETLHLTYCLLLHARACAILRRFRDGREAAGEGLSLSQKFNQHYLEAELWRVDGELAFHSGESDAAAAALVRARETALEQGANWLALRALSTQSGLFPEDQEICRQLQDVADSICSSHDVPAFRSMTEALSRSG